ncbi:MAG: flagellar basal body L-ring protein FlgH [Hyphomicrobium sp.]
MIARPLIFPLLAILLSACAVDVRDFNREPHMTPVGSGMVPKRVAMVMEPAPPAVYRGNSSIWQDSRADLFSDLRARKIGDTVTVKILMKDKASLANDSERKRDASNSIDLGVTYGATSSDITIANAATGAQAPTPRPRPRAKVASSAPRRSISRSPPSSRTCCRTATYGNLVISGSQEVRVNFEMRVVNVAGIVRPVDISAENTIAYEKIAEARIAYGGRGRLTEVQQPPWGQQLVDDVLPW